MAPSMITMDELARHVPENGALFRAVIRKHLDDRSALLNINILAGKLSDPLDRDIWPAGPAADTFFAAAVTLSELARDAPINEILCFAHAMCRFAVAFQLLQASDQLGLAGARLQ
jgi:hypothetical protein